MKMQVNNINNMQSNALQSIKSAEENAEREKENAEEIVKNLHGNDEYIPSEKDEPIGLYAVSQDDEGNQEIYYDAPNKSADKNKKAADSPQKSEDSKSGDKSEKSDGKEKSESCTANTDKVDREIERLKKRLNELEQRVIAAEGMERERIEKQIKALEGELAQKDNDTYRRQNTVFS